MSETNSLMEKYREKMESSLGPDSYKSSEYNDFKDQYVTHEMTLYEKACNFSESLIAIAPDAKKLPELTDAIEKAHLRITPTGATSFAMLLPLSSIVISIMLSLLFSSGFFGIFFFIVLGASMIGPLNKLPFFIAASWRMKSSNQMVLGVFYIVTFMRHTSNLELALEFAADHVSPPLSIDLRKVLWNVETGKFASVKESLDNYLEGWRTTNMEFVESFHLIESSLFEGEERARIETLDKALDIILSETYEKMLHYAQNLKGPITMLHMLGVILPILGLVLLPLIVSFLENARWQNIALVYNIGFPVMVLYIGKKVLAQRPTGYGSTDLSELDEFKKQSGLKMNFGAGEVLISPMKVAVFIFVLLFIIGLSPIYLKWFVANEAGFGFGGVDETSTCLRQFCILDYRGDIDNLVGPFGLGASFLSLFIPLAFGLSIGVYYKLKSANVMGVKTRTEKLENEFASGLFQLGNRLGDGMPAETAFGRVASSLEGSTSGAFFQVVSNNVTRLGMGVDEAIFNKQNGALTQYPSNLIESSMKVLTESVKKGPKVAAVALINISRYVKEIHKVNERLKDLMSEVIASMSSQIKFLTPVISGIVIGITSMVTTILGKLSVQMQNLGTGDAGGILAGGFFGQGVPTYFFQIVVGIYLVEITYILTILSNGIENGQDKLNEKYMLGKNMVRSTVLYCGISLVIMMLFNMIANSIMAGGLAG